MKLVIAKHGIFRLSHAAQLWLEQAGLPLQKHEAKPFFSSPFRLKTALELEDEYLLENTKPPIFRFTPCKKFVYFPYIRPHLDLRAHPLLVQCLESLGCLAQVDCTLAVVDVPDGEWRIAHDEVGEFVESAQHRRYV